MRNWINIVNEAHVACELDEAIAQPPRNLKAFLDKKVKDLDWVIKELEAAEEMVAKNTDLGESLLVQFLKYGTDYAEAAHEIDSLIWMCGKSGDRSRLDRYLPLADLKRSIESYIQYGPDFLQYVTGAFKYVEAVDERARAVIAILPTAEAGAKQYGYDEHSEKDEEYHAAIGLLKGLRRLATVIERGEAIWADLKGKLDIITSIRGAHFSGKKYRPEHEEVETLYHASIHVSELATEGFKAEKPEGRTGVGNFGDQDLVSFTHDYKITQDIVRALKEFWMIAHGQVTLKTIIGWMEAEGIDYKSRSFIDQVGIGVNEPKTHGEWTFDHHRTKEVRELKDPKEIATLYNVYLWRTKLRTNPVFANLDRLMSQMLEVDIKDIGIVACEVKLDQDDEYLQAEREFRVAATKVISVKRVL